MLGSKFITKAYKKTPRKGEIFLTLVLLAAIGGGLYLLKKEILTDTGETIRYFGYCATVVAIMYATLQFRANHDWKRRQFAMVSLREMKESINKHIIVLDEAFNYVHLTKLTPIAVEDIHKKICETDGEGECIIKDQKLVLSKDDPAKTIRRAILNLLNSHEFIAAGVYQGVFDKEVVSTLHKGNFIKSFYVFQAYIKHFNDDMNKDRNGTIWVNLKHLAKEFEGPDTADTPQTRSPPG